MATATWRTYLGHDLMQQPNRSIDRRVIAFLAVTPLVPNLVGTVVAVGLRQHLKNDANHVHRTMYYVP